MNKIRCFCAVELPENLREGIIDFRKNLGDSMGKVRWTRPEGMHLTLKFLGDQEESFISKLSDAFADVCKDFLNFEVGFEGAGFFPNARRPRVVWIGVKSGSSELIELNRRIEKKLSKMGIPKEKRKFNPHLTLGRIKDAAKDFRIYEEFLNENDEQDFGSFKCSELNFFQSILKPSGAEYIKLGNYKFN